MDNQDQMKLYTSNMAEQLTPEQQRQMYIQEFMGSNILQVPSLEDLTTYWNNNLLREPDLQFDIDVRSNHGLTALLWYAGTVNNISCIPHLIFLLNNGANLQATIIVNANVQLNALHFACIANNILHIIFFLHLGFVIQTWNQYVIIIALQNNLTDANITSYIQEVTNVVSVVNLQIPGEGPNKIIFIRNLILERIQLYEQQHNLPAFNNNQLNKKYLKYKAKYLQLKNQLN